ncbi:MAG TPA: alpha-1,4-glucan--maltose-1-phosphate maltosyltransferase [Methylomirabilota bacterium]|nr:alpha-1,4-glucan--maltose-1-phosphate maltosyltransferase [Methylomirabilota bacterium]
MIDLAQLSDEAGRARIIISGVRPEIEHGRFAVKRTVGEKVAVEADIFTDGHDAVAAVVLYRYEQEAHWRLAPLHALGNDRWRGQFLVTKLGRYRYTLRAWIDRFASWREGVHKKLVAGQDVSVELLMGARLLGEASFRAAAEDAAVLEEWASLLRDAPETVLAQHGLEVLPAEVVQLMAKYPDQRFAVTYDKELLVTVDRERARFSAWYELFPRSCAPEPGRHGSFKDCEARLPYIAAMGFDVVYLPPIHPIGRTHRKGKNNTLAASPDDPGSPWAIGAAEGGHTAIHPQLGALEDFRHFIAQARTYGIEVAMDLAFQCSPDHPYVREHPEWFRHRPDGSIQYAENPPKQYQDVYPLDFETNEWRALWEELRRVTCFWIDQGVRIFRVDNPHTKPFHFWAWLIETIKQRYPEVIFLAEAFTRPKVMRYLAQLGFTQSYTYFTWRNTKDELTHYFTELTKTDMQEYFRPHVWPNTPDILSEYLQLGGRPAFIVRLVLAATLSANYGIYGPAFELCEHRARERGSEEYLNSEKYEIRHWNLHQPESLKDIIARINAIRRDNPALQQNQYLSFHPVENPQLLCYSKTDESRANVILVVVNLDPHHTHAGWVELALDELGLDARQTYQVHDLLGDARYLWQGARNYVELNPQVAPAHIFRIRRHLRTERDFDYYM